MKPPAWLAQFRPDGYVALIFLMVAVGSIWAAHGEAADPFSFASKLLIALVFFLHGARLSREAVIGGLIHWRLHLVVLAATYLLFPLLCLGLTALPGAITPPALAPGLILLGCLPSTIQSSIGFTLLARGNVPAAVAAASASNLLAIFLTPLMVGLLLHTQGGASPGAIQAILLQLLVPFLAGQVLRPVVGKVIAAQKAAASYVDRGAILLVVYVAFSAAVNEGVWRTLAATDLLRLLLICAGLLAVVLIATREAARRLGFSKADEIAIVFCGSKKSLASGAPMVSVLLAGPGAALALLPLMVFHQIQLMACAVIAAAYAKRRDSATETV